MKKIILFVILVMLGYIGTSAWKSGVESEKEVWQKIGETTVDFKSEINEIIVQGSNRFGFVKIKIKDAPVNLISFKFFFESGDEQKVVVGEEIKVEGETPAVHLNGGERAIKRVSFIYKTVPDNENIKASVELWAMKTNMDNFK